jgi:hypothetical protein
MSGITDKPNRMLHRIILISPRFLQMCKIHHIISLTILFATTIIIQSDSVDRTSYISPTYASAVFRTFHTPTFIITSSVVKQQQQQQQQLMLRSKSVSNMVIVKRQQRRLQLQHAMTCLNLSLRDNNNNNNFMNRLQGENEDEFFSRIVSIASNPQRFENAVLKRNETMTQSLEYQQEDVSNNTNSGMNSSTQSVGTKSKYVRVEEWDAEEQRKMKSSNWEERVQFDGQLYGNRFNQNEILRHHLKGF